MILQFEKLLKQKLYLSEDLRMNGSRIHLPDFQGGDDIDELVRKLAVCVKQEHDHQQSDMG